MKWSKWNKKNLRYKLCNLREIMIKKEIFNINNKLRIKWEILMKIKIWIINLWNHHKIQYLNLTDPTGQKTKIKINKKSILNRNKMIIIKTKSRKCQIQIKLINKQINHKSKICQFKKKLGKRIKSLKTLKISCNKKLKIKHWIFNKNQQFQRPR